MAADDSTSDSRPQTDSMSKSDKGQLVEHLSGEERFEETVEGRLREREDRPLVLEERHSLSIAETKKRRASVYSHENLFIPKELARGELNLRRCNYSLNSPEQIRQNSEQFCIRMLKFPVGSGRARYVAHQLKRKKNKKSKEKTKEHAKREPCQRRKLGSNSSKADMSVRQDSITIAKKDQQAEMLPLSMPNLEVEQAVRNQLLHSDDECCIILEDIVDINATGTEGHVTETLKDQLSHRHPDVTSRDDDHSLEATQELLQVPVFRWHNPTGNIQNIQLVTSNELEQITASANTGLHVGFNEVALRDVNEKSEEEPQVANSVVVAASYPPAREREYQTPEEQRPLQDSLPTQSEVQAPLLQASAVQQEMLQAQTVQHVEGVPYLPNAGATNCVYPPIENPPTDLQQLLIQRIILPSFNASEAPNAPNAPNGPNGPNNDENIQRQFMETLVPAEFMQHWRKEKCKKHAGSQPRLSRGVKRQQHAQRHSLFLEKQQLETGQMELQHLNAEYQQMKCREDEQLKSINKTLKEIYANRLKCERQHADYHRSFMHKMIESKKQEENLQAHRKQLKSQLEAELSSLEQRIAAKHRQLHERERSWQYHRQQQEQQLQLHQQQLQQQLYEQQQLQRHQQQQQELALSQHPNFYHLQPHLYQPQLQCFQDCFPRSIEARSPPTSELEAQSRVFLGPPPAVYLAGNVQQPPGAANLTSDRHSNMRRRHTIDYRAHNPYRPHPLVHSQSRNCLSFGPGRGPCPGPGPGPGPAPATVTSNIIAGHGFTLPETPIASGSSQVNQAIEQTAITSIISNYVSNYLNNMESGGS